MARKINNSQEVTKLQARDSGPELGGEHMERVTRIELALSAWEVEQSRPLAALTCHFWCPLVAVIYPSSPWLMAR